MDEFAITDINTNMAESAPHGIEKYQVARLQIGFIYLLGCRCLLLGLSGQQQADALPVHRNYEAAAIKSSFGSVSSPLVGNTQKPHGVDNQL